MQCVNKCCATSLINNEITHLASNSALGMENLLNLAWLTWSLLDMKFSLNHQEVTHIQSEQTFISILYFLFTSGFFNSLNFFYLSNDKSPSIRTIRFEVSITMSFETLFTRQSPYWFTSNLFTLVKSFDGCRGSDSFVGGGVTLGVTQRTNRGSSLKGFLALKLLLNLDS